MLQVRVASLDAIKHAVLLGGHEMIYQLGAFQDPNLVPVAAFYEPTVSINFLSKLAQDGSPQVNLDFILCHHLIFSQELLIAPRAACSVSTM